MFLTTPPQAGELVSRQVPLAVPVGDSWKKAEEMPSELASYLRETLHLSGVEGAGVFGGDALLRASGSVGIIKAFYLSPQLFFSHVCRSVRIRSIFNSMLNEPACNHRMEHCDTKPFPRASHKLIHLSYTY